MDIRSKSHISKAGVRVIAKIVPDWGYVHSESGLAPTSPQFKYPSTDLKTVNIYSHLIGSFLFVILPIYVFRTEIPPRYKIATSADLGVCSIYFIGVAICFLLSATFHTIMNHSHKVGNLGMQLDFQGVILLTWGATVPLIYYGFYCDKELQWVYWPLLSTFAIGCSIATFQPRFSDPFLRPFRAATFGRFAFSSVIPIIHGITKYGWALQSQRMGLKWVLITLGLNTLGAMVYAIGFPERWFKKTFDIFGAGFRVRLEKLGSVGTANPKPRLSDPKQKANRLGFVAVSLTPLYILLEGRFTLEAALSEESFRDNSNSSAPTELLSFLFRNNPTNVSKRSMYGMTCRESSHSKQAADPDEVFFEISHVITTILLKLSIGILLLPLTSPRSAQRWTIFLTTGLYTLVGIGLIFLLAFQCYPLSSFWDPSIPGYCHSPTYIAVGAYINTIAGGGTDFVLACLPVWLLWDLKLNWKTKGSIAVLLGLGNLSAAVNVIRLIHIPSIMTSEDILCTFFLFLRYISKLTFLGRHVPL
ncbi:hypothetical protein G7Y89_g15164 [Cudoniella acicularis]|uniref:Rhodopsin domain-containing protein n=1 Tax=Cudoniella acicularis TaxID=354080 RepID=A0A8H4VNL2_9HELO|nr:hypothetical protein G7Y89_g15164 [Cudoniella acicularis]